MLHTGRKRGRVVPRADFVTAAGVAQVDMPGVVVASVRRCAGLVDMAEQLAAALVGREMEHFEMDQHLDLSLSGSCH